MSQALKQRIEAFSSSAETSADKARLAALKAPNARDWLIAQPGKGEHTIIPCHEYKLMIRFRLGLSPVDILCKFCYSCNKTIPLLEEKDDWHFLSCIIGHGGREITARHHQVVYYLAYYLRLAGAIVIIEPAANQFAESRKRPDFDQTC